MTRLCSLDGDLTGFDVSNLTYHDDVRVLTQESLQRRGEGQSHLWIYIDLIDTRQVNFSRVLGSGNVPVLGIENIQSCVQGHRFTTTGWAGHQDHALWLLQGFHVKLFLVFLITQSVDT